jgi:SsrA-binding protein
MGRKADADGEKTVASNRRATHDYEIVDRYETGLKLTGSEVKSLRAGRGSLAEAYARISGGEVWLDGFHIPPYEQGQKRGYDPIRPRKLLLHLRQIEELMHKTAERGWSLIPLRVYFVHGIAKLELGLGRGKRQYEKRQAVAERDSKREIEQAAGRRR